MKDKVEQLKCLDYHLLPLYGIKSIVDYKTKISLNDVKNNPDIIAKLNKFLPEIKKCFPVKEFNLHKTNNMVSSYTQAYAILKICLEIANIPFDIVKENSINYVRLIQENIFLKNYIYNKKMSDIRINIEKDIGNVIKASIIENLEYPDFVKEVQVREEIVHYMPLSLAPISNGQITFNLTKIMENTDMIKVELCADEPSYMNEIVNNIFEGSRYTFNMGSEIIYSGKLKIGENIFPNNIEVIPFKLNLYHEFFLHIHPNDSFMNSLKDFQDYTSLKVIITKSIFSKKMQTLMNNPSKTICMTVPWSHDEQNHSTLFFFAGEIKYNTIKTPKLIALLSNEPPTAKISKDYKTLMIGKYKCIHFNQSKIDQFAFDYFSALSALSGTMDDTYNISIQRVRYPLHTTVQSYTKVNNNVYFTYVPLRISDCIDNIEIHFPLAINNKCSIEVVRRDTLYETPNDVKYVYTDYQWDSERKNLKIKYMPGFILTSSYKPYIAFNFIMENISDKDITYIIKNSFISFDAMLCDQSIVKHLMVRGDDLVIE
jgi:hypothetical protein